MINLDFKKVVTEAAKTWKVGKFSYIQNGTFDNLQTCDMTGYKNRILKISQQSNSVKTYIQ